MGKTWCIAALALALSPLAAPAQEYAIKIGRPGLGDKFQVKINGTHEGEFKALDSDNNVKFEAKETKITKFVFREVGLERAGDELVKVKRQYEHADRIVKGERRTLPYQGKTLLIEKKGGKFQFQIENDEEIVGKEAEELNEEFNKGGFHKLIPLLLPRKAVKVDDTWKVDTAFLAKEFGKDGKVEIDAAKSTGTGKLLKAYQKNGKQCGVYEVTMTFPVTQFTTDSGDKGPTKDSKFSLKLTVDGPIDGTLGESHINVELNANINASINTNGMDLTLVISLRANSEQVRVPIAK